MNRNAAPNPAHAKEHIRNLTEVLAARIMKRLAEDMGSLDRDQLKDFIRGLIEKVELDPDAATIQLTYYLNAEDRVASSWEAAPLAGYFQAEDIRVAVQ